MDISSSVGVDMTPAIFYQFTHPDPNTLTMVAFDLDSMDYMRHIDPLQVFPGNVPDTDQSINKWLQQFDNNIVLITNGISYHYPLLINLFSIHTNINKFHPTMLDINAMAMWANIAAGLENTPFVNNEGVPSTGIDAQMGLFGIAPAGFTPYDNVITMIRVFLKHVKSLKGFNRW